MKHTKATQRCFSFSFCPGFSVSLYSLFFLFVYTLHLWNTKKKHLKRGEKRFAVMRFYGNFIFCGFKTLSGLGMLQSLGRGFWWKKSVCDDDSLYNGRHSVVLRARAKCFVLRIRVYYISLQFNSVVCNYGIFQLILNAINRFGQWCIDFGK